MSTFGTNYSTAEIRQAQAVQDAISYYLVDKTMPNYGTLYGDREKRLAIAIVENTSIGGGDGSISDGNKGDVTVSGGGTNWAVNALPQSRITNLVSDLSEKQPALVSSTNIKTVNNQSILGPGNLSVTTVPAGLDTQIQFNNGGVLGASSNLTWNGTDLKVMGKFGLNQATPLARLDIVNSIATQPTLKLTGASGQSANISELYLNDGTLKSWYTNSGNFFVKGKVSIAETLFAVQRASNTTNFLQVVNDAGDSAITTIIDGGSNALSVGGASGIGININNASAVNIHTSGAKGQGTLNIFSRNTFITSYSAANTPLIVGIGTGITQTANLIETRNSSNVAMSVLSKSDGSYTPVTLTDSAATNSSFYYSSTQSRVAYKDGTGNIVIPINKLGDNNVSPLVFKAGGTTTGTAPIKLTTQSAPLVTPEQGAFELVGNSLQFTQLALRRAVAMSQSVRTSSTSITNSTTESASLIDVSHGANYLEIGKCEEIIIRGTIQQANAGGGTLQIRVKYANITIQTIVTVAGNIAATPFILEIAGTCRSTGASGTMQFDSFFRIDGLANNPDASTLVNIDTTTAQNTTVTMQWTVASPNNSCTISQARVLCIDPSK